MGFNPPDAFTMESSYLWIKWEDGYELWEGKHMEDNGRDQFQGTC
jgi:hypothetical protein